MNLKVLAISLLCLFLMGCWHPTHLTPVRVEVAEPSAFLGTTYSTTIHMAYELNLPRHDEVSERIQKTSSTLFSEKVDRRLIDIENHCGGCLNKDRLTTPIRIQSIPLGTEMTVVDEYIYHSDYGAWLNGATNIHMLIIRDEHGNLSEVSKIGFELKFINDTFLNMKPDRRERWLLYNMSEFAHNGELILNFCPSSRVKGAEDPREFIADFELEDEVAVSPNTYACRAGSKIEFLTLEAYLTANYYFSDWRLYGTFNSYCEECPTEWKKQEP